MPTVDNTPYNSSRLQELPPLFTYISTKTEELQGVNIIRETINTKSSTFGRLVCLIPV